MRTADILGQVKPALSAFVSWLSGSPAPEGASLEDLARVYGEVKAKGGRDAVSGKLGLQDSDLTIFDGALREAARRIDRLAPDTPVQEQRNAAIAGMRFMSWLETFAARDAGFAFAPKLPDQNDEVGRKQVRALELILRSLITERYENQAALTARLKELLSEKAVQQFLSSADRGDVLSGTTFSDLASLLVSTQEYPGYDPLFKETPFLSLLKEKRVTIRNFLDDIRRIRNTLAHNKRVTPLQLQLLNTYYEELSEPLQEAFDQGRSKTNPEAFLDVSAEELQGYFGKLTTDVRAVRDDIAELRADLTGRLDEIKGDTSAIRETATRIAQTTTSVNRKQWAVLGGIAAALAGIGLVGWLVFGQGETTKQIAKTTEQTQKTAEQIAKTTDQVAESTQRIEAAIGDIAEGFAKIDRAGGVISNPQRPEEHYHNAIVYEAKGDAANARKEYLAFAESDLDAIDVYERFARLVRVQDGRSGARELFGDLSRRLKAPAFKLVYAMQFEDAERTKRMDEFLTANPNYGPGYYLMAQEFSEERTGGQSVADKQREFELYNKFLAADAQGTLIKHFVDQQVLGAWLDRARERVKVLEPQLQATRAQPSMTQSRNNAGWTVVFIIPEAALQIFYRIGEDGEWLDTGTTGMIDQRTGKPMPVSYISLPSDQGPVTIYLRYINANGEEMGPFEMAFVTSSALVEEQKRLLEMTWTSWVVIQPNPGNPEQQLIYFTHLSSYRCGIERAAYSINGAALDQAFELPPCNEADPVALPPDFLPFMQSPPGLTSMSVQITYKDGTKSPIREFKPK